MELLGIALLAFYAQHFTREHLLGQRLERQRITSYRHPALAPVRIQSPEFYAQLSSRYNRPFLGK